MPGPNGAPPSGPVRLEAGDRIPERPIGPLTRTDIVRFAGAGGDFNPIHHDETAARAAGFDSVFAMGMFQAALLEHRLGAWVGPANLEELSVRFVGQVWPGDELLVTGEVESVDPSPEGRRAAISLGMATVEDGREVLRARAVARAAP